jgi:hypothetical protein
MTGRRAGDTRWCCGTGRILLAVSGPTSAAGSEAQRMNFPRAEPGEYFEKLAVTIRNTAPDSKPWSLLALTVHDTDGHSMDYSIQPTDLVSLITLAPHEARSATAFVLLSAGQMLGSVSLETWRIGEEYQFQISGREVNRAC